MLNERCLKFMDEPKQLVRVIFVTHRLTTHKDLRSIQAFMQSCLQLHQALLRIGGPLIAGRHPFDLNL